MKRADVSPLCYWVDTADGRRVPEFSVVADARGWFNVLCARTGKTYRVAVDGSCSCDASQCRHLAVVLVHARHILGR